jgi:hypothetical protein
VVAEVGHHVPARTERRVRVARGHQPAALQMLATDCGPA